MKSGALNLLARHTRMKCQALRGSQYACFKQDIKTDYEVHEVDRTLALRPKTSERLYQIMHCFGSEKICDTELLYLQFFQNGFAVNGVNPSVPKFPRTS